MQWLRTMLQCWSLLGASGWCPVAYSPVSAGCAPLPPGLTPAVWGAGAPVICGHGTTTHRSALQHSCACFTAGLLHMHHNLNTSGTRQPEGPAGFFGCSRLPCLCMWRGTRCRAEPLCAAMLKPDGSLLPASCCFQGQPGLRERIALIACSLLAVPWRVGFSAASSQQ